MDAIGAAVRAGWGLATAPQRSAQGRLFVIKAGTFCRSVIWPCALPLAFHQYIRGKDRDMFALELLAYRSKTTKRVARNWFYAEAAGLPT